MQAQDKGFINATRASLDTYVDDMMNFSDDAFESNKRIIANMNPSKRGSGALPRVGADAAAEAMNVTASVKPVEPNQINPLASLGWK